METNHGFPSIPIKLISSGKSGLLQSHRLGNKTFVTTQAEAELMILYGYDLRQSRWIGEDFFD